MHLNCDTFATVYFKRDQKMAYDTRTLREAAKGTLAAAGMAVEPESSGHAANQLYRVRADAERNPGKLVRLRTNNRWAILDYATGPEANAPIEQLEGVDFVCGVCVNPQGEIEVYFIPAGRVDADMKAEHTAFMERTKGRGNSKVRILKFRHTLLHYAEFKLGQASAPAAPGRSGGDVIEQAQRMIGEAYGVPPSAVHISIDLTTPQPAKPRSAGVGGIA